MNTSSSISLQYRKAASIIRGSFDVWHKLDYLMGDCTQCGFHLLSLCPLELSDSNTFCLKWKCLKYY
jgi:hypothetical protein